MATMRVSIVYKYIHVEKALSLTHVWPTTPQCDQFVTSAPLELSFVVTVIGSIAIHLKETFPTKEQVSVSFRRAFTHDSGKPFVIFLRRILHHTPLIMG